MKNLLLVSALFLSGTASSMAQDVMKQPSAAKGTSVNMQEMHNPEMKPAQKNPENNNERKVADNRQETIYTDAKGQKIVVLPQSGSAKSAVMTKPDAFPTKKKKTTKK